MPFGNYTGTRTRPYPGPGTHSHGRTLTIYTSGSSRPPSTSFPRSILSGTTSQFASGYGQPISFDDGGSTQRSDSISSTETAPDYENPTATDVSGRSYSGATGFPTGLGSSYAKPTDSYANFTGFPTGSGSSYATPNASGGLGDPFGHQSTSLEPTSSARLPPSPSTLHYYPAVSTPATPIVLYGYNFDG